MRLCGVLSGAAKRAEKYFRMAKTKFAEFMPLLVAGGDLPVAVALCTAYDSNELVCNAQHSAQRTQS